MKNPFKALRKTKGKSQRHSLANNTLDEIANKAAGVNKRLRHVQSELGYWNQSKGSLEHIIETYGGGKEEDALMVVVDHNIETLQSNVDSLRKAAHDLHSYEERALHAKNTFDIFDSTKYLMGKTNENFTLESPMSELMEVRRAVFNLEGYKEIMS